MKKYFILALSLGLMTTAMPAAQAEGSRTETKTTTTQTHVFPGDATVTETTTRTRIEEHSSTPVMVETTDKMIGNPSLPHGSIDVATRAEVYPVAVRFIPREIWYQDTPESTYMGVYSANRMGDPAWIVAGFAPDEGDEVSAMVYDEAMLARNTALAQSIVNETILGREEYNDHAILRVKLDLANGETRIVRMPFRQINGRWYLTNDLQGDAAFMPVEE